MTLPRWAKNLKIFKKPTGIDRAIFLFLRDGHRRLIRKQFHFWATISVVLVVKNGQIVKDAVKIAKTRSHYRVNDPKTTVLAIRMAEDLKNYSIST